MSWLKKILPGLSKSNDKKAGIPDGLWVQCPACNATLYRESLEQQHSVCEHCGHHLRLGARSRLKQLLDHDESSWVEIGAALEPIDYLQFKDTKKYKDRLVAARKKTGEKSALVVMKGKIFEMPAVVAAFEFGFIGGSMGAAVGARFVAAVDQCIQDQIPFICVSASGGARMQEGLFSLMQMSKTSAALAKLSAHGLPYISVLTDPTTGGVSASLAMLGDVIIAEPKALIGFAGPRVIQQTVGEILPDGFQRSEFLLEKGAIDMIVPRSELKQAIYDLLSKLMSVRAA